MSHDFYGRDAGINSHDGRTIKGDELLSFIVINIIKHAKLSVSELNEFQVLYFETATYSYHIFYTKDYRSFRYRVLIKNSDLFRPVYRNLFYMCLIYSI